MVIGYILDMIALLLVVLLLVLLHDCNVIQIVWTLFLNRYDWSSSDQAKSTMFITPDLPASIRSVCIYTIGIG